MPTGKDIHSGGSSRNCMTMTQGQRIFAIGVTVGIMVGLILILIATSLGFWC